jgi:hypothetical protein
MGHTLDVWATFLGRLVFGPLTLVFGPLLGHFTTFWVTCGPLVGHLWATFGPLFRATLVIVFGPLNNSFMGHFDPFFGPLLGHFTTFWVTCGPLVGHFWATF